MPTYSYACLACDHRFDAVQSITDETLTACPLCGHSLRRVYGTVGVSFRGSGFYRNDSRPKADATTKADGASKAAAAPKGDASTKTDTGPKAHTAPKGDSAPQGNTASRS